MKSALNFGVSGSLLAKGLLLLLLIAHAAAAQTPLSGAASASEGVSAGGLEASNVLAWSFSSSLYGYLVPDSRDYVQPTFTADRGWLHLEARYNYENWATGSAWVGYNLEGEGTLSWAFTPMFGGVVGNTTGLAPGYELTLDWWKLELYSEGEYVVDTGDSSRNFFYNWSELSLRPKDWFRVGLATQRTRAYQTDRDIQRGLLAGVTYKQTDFTTYVFNLDEGKPTIVLAVAVRF
jgi:hypothetical protein